MSPRNEELKAKNTGNYSQTSFGFKKGSSEDVKERNDRHENKKTSFLSLILKPLRDKTIIQEIQKRKEWEKIRHTIWNRYPYVKIQLSKEKRRRK